MKTVLIIGTSRGLGLGLTQEYLSRGWAVIGTTRSTPTSQEWAQVSRHAHFEFHRLELTSVDEIKGLQAKLAGRQIDALIVNAGVSNDHREKIGELSVETFHRVMDTNVLGAMRAVEVFSSLVPDSGVIAAMSSYMGSVSSNTNGDAELYRASKAALNSLLRSFSARQSPQRALVAMHPGWVRTDMGGARAPLDVATSVKGVADVLAAEAGKPGVRFVNYRGATIEW